MKIVVLTGAGISAESGIRTFRGGEGLWENHRIEDVATPEAFARDPALVHEFYNQRRRQLLDPSIQPNAAHLSLARLEREHMGEILVVTQNVDNLHERAGSRKLIHMHGALQWVRCVKCEARIHDWSGDLSLATPCPSCASVSRLRPDIVWFGEMPHALDEIYNRLESCDLFVSIGTSGHVYPAAGFVQAAPRARKIEFNLDESQIASHFDEHHAGPAGQTVPLFVDQLLK